MNKFTHEAHERYTEEEYTNFGFLHGLKAIDIIGALVDSWYYLDYTDVGTMPLPASGMTADSGVGDYLCEQILNFAEATGDLFQLNTGIWVAFTGQTATTRRVSNSVDGPTLAAMLEMLKVRIQSVQELPVGGAQIMLEATVYLRQPEGTIALQQLHHVGMISVHPLVHEYRSQLTTPGAAIPWEATLKLGILSLFQEDNSQVLALVRQSWKDLRKRNPNLTWDNREGPIPPLAVTLVEPPSATPADNQQLYQYNWPRLQTAIAQWEQTVGHRFRWA